MTTTLSAKERNIKDILNERHSIRNYTSKKLSDKKILDILWAGNGVNAHGRRTAPSAVNAQEIEMYVCTADGVRKYVAEEKKLHAITEEDIRPLIQAQNKFMLNAPVTILLVANLEKFDKPRPDNRNQMFGYIDAGIVSQNISLYCTSVGLATVPCSPRMNTEEVLKALKLNNQNIVVLYHPIGYPAE